MRIMRKASPLPRSHRAAGYTLLSVLTTVAIAGIVGTVAVDTGSEMVRTARTTAAGAEVTSALHRARQVAMSEQRVIFVALETDGANGLRSIWMLRDDGNGVFSDFEDDPIFETLRLDARARLGDGRGNVTSLPDRAEEGSPALYALAFGPRGESHKRRSLNFNHACENKERDIIIKNGLSHRLGRIISLV